ncbi:helicase RepA family protein [Tateyamaria sp.]|nr:helicase RepA family protein [Tateyamaria sp.]
MKNTTSTNALSAPTFNGISPVSANNFQINPNRPFLVKGLLLAGQVGMIAGEPNLGKSAIMACVASFVAMGRNMGNMKVNRGAVLYVAAEDPEGILERAYPYMHNAPDGAAAFEVLDVVPNLTDPKAVKEFSSYAEAFREYHECDYLLIVFDTLNLSIGDADENSARDMSRVFRHAQFIAKSTGAHVLFVHHVGTGDKGRPRGSSAMTATLDTLLTLEKAEDDSGAAAMLLQKKQKRIRKGRALAFRIESFEAGTDDDGDVFTVPMAVPFRHDNSLTITKEAKAKRSTKPSVSGERAAEVLRLLKGVAKHDAGKWHSRKEIGELVGGPFNETRANGDSHRKAVSRALESLQNAGSVEKGECGGFRYSAPFEVIDDTVENENPTLH